MSSSDVKTEYLLRVFTGDVPDGQLARMCAVRIGKAAIMREDYTRIISELPDIIQLQMPMHLVQMSSNG